MPITIIKRISIISLMILLPFVSSCEKQHPPLRVATSPWPGYELLHLAESLGYFKNEGVNVKLIEFMSLGDSSRAFARGQVDALGATLVELLLNHANSNRKPQAFFVTNVSVGADMILAKNTLHSVKDLKGKRIAVEPATVNVVVLFHALSNAGLSLDDVTLVPTPQSDMLRSLKNGSVDAASVYPPVSESLLETDTVIKLFDTVNANMVLDVLAADKQVLESRADDFSKLIRAFERARLYMLKHKEDAYQIMAKREGLTVEHFKHAIKGIQVLNLENQKEYFAVNGKLSEAVQSTTKILTLTGQLDKKQLTVPVFNDTVVSKLLTQ